MKRLTLFVAMIATVFVAKAQDLIVLRNATEIQAKVVAINPESISYKRSSNIDGPTYTILKSEVFYIKYQNGEKDVISEAATTPAAPAKSYTQKAPKKTTMPITPIKFSGHAMVGSIFGDISLAAPDPYSYYTAPALFVVGPTLDISAGAKIYEHFYLGVETGFHSGFFVEHENTDLFLGFVPIGANMKGYFTRGRMVNQKAKSFLGFDK